MPCVLQENLEGGGGRPRRQRLWSPLSPQAEGWPEELLLHPRTWATREQVLILGFCKNYMAEFVVLGKT